MYIAKTGAKKPIAFMSEPETDRHAALYNNVMASLTATKKRRNRISMKTGRAAGLENVDNLRPHPATNFVLDTENDVEVLTAVRYQTDDGNGGTKRHFSPELGLRKLRT